MTEFQGLSSDQQALLSGVLDAGKGYGQLARELGISEAEARARAHAALDALAKAASSAGDSASQPAAPSLPAPSVPQRDESSGSMKAGIIAGLVLGSIAAAVILITNHSGSGSRSPSPPNFTRRTATPSRAGGLTLLKRIPLAPARGTPKATGTAYVVAQGAQRRVFITAQRLSRGSHYQLWLYKSASSYTPVGQEMTASVRGSLQGAGNLPASAGSYRTIILTREAGTHPSRPGQVALSGPFSVR